MFRFANPTYLYLLLVLAVFALLHYFGLYMRRRDLARYGEPHLVSRLIKDYSLLRGELKFWLLQASLAFFILALARPQNGTKEAERDRYGIEAIVALDISNSMLAQDVHPNRLDKSKRLITNMMKQMGDDQIGMVIFAGSAFTQVPITSDFATAQMYLDQIEPSLIELQGTDIARAIQLSQKSFTDREGINRAIFVITDGEDNEGGAVEAAKEASKAGIHVFVLGIGSPEGAKIPIPGTTQYIIDNEGNTVVTKLNEQMCRDIAKAGEGAYIYVDNSSSAQEALDKYLDQLSKTKLDVSKYTEYNEKYQLFLLIGLILLICDALIMARQNHLFQRVNLFGKKGAMLFLLLMSLGTLTSCTGDSFRDHVRRGNRNYALANDTLCQDSSYIYEACTEYERAITKDSTVAIAHYNAGNAYLLTGKDSIAMHEYMVADSLESDFGRQAHIHRNIGVLLQSNSVNAPDSMKYRLLQGAVENYKSSLRYDPKNDETRYNLALCLWQLKKDNQGQQGGGGEGQDNSEQEDQQQQKQDQQKQEQKQQEQQEQQQQQQPNEASEQMINAAMQKERETQNRMNMYDRAKRMEDTEEQEARPRRLQKNW